MAKQRWGTFSVEDHRFIDKLVPDILCFDKLVFPYPEDDKERARWEREGWDPTALDLRLTQMGDLVKVHMWGKKQRAEFGERFKEARAPERLEIPWEYAKFITQDTIAAAMQRENAEDCWLMPRYGSLAALQADKSFGIRPVDHDRRRTRLSVLLGCELALPASADAQEAFELAIDLANDEAFRRARRDLYWKQEMTVLQDQTAKRDAEEFADLVATFNAQVAAKTKATTKGWIFTVLKTSKELAEVIEKPFSTLLGVALEIAETATETENIPSGPIAMFHHAKRRVFDPAMQAG